MDDKIKAVRFALVEFGMLISHTPYTDFNELYDRYLGRVREARDLVVNRIVQCEAELLNNEIKAADGAAAMRELCRHTLTILSETLNYKQHYGTGNHYGIPFDYTKATTDADKNLIFDAHRVAMAAMALVLRFWLESVLRLNLNQSDPNDADEQAMINTLITPFLDSTANNNINNCRKNVTCEATHPYLYRVAGQTGFLAGGTFTFANHYPTFWRAHLFRAAYTMSDALAAVITFDELINAIRREPVEECQLIYDNTNYREDLWRRLRQENEYAADPVQTASNLQVLQTDGSGYTIRQQEKVDILYKAKAMAPKHYVEFFDVCFHRPVIQELVVALAELKAVANNPGASFQIPALVDIYDRSNGDPAAYMPDVKDPTDTPPSCLLPPSPDLDRWDREMNTWSANNSWQYPTNGFVLRPSDTNGRAARILMPRDVTWIDCHNLRFENGAAAARINNHDLTDSWSVYYTRRSLVFVHSFGNYLKCLIDMYTWTVGSKRANITSVKEVQDRAPKQPPKMFVHPHSWAWDYNGPAAANGWTAAKQRLLHQGQLINIQPGAGPAAPRPAAKYQIYHRR